MQLARSSYEIADALPDYEKYGLASQIRRSATSLPSNIAEGSGRRTDKEYARFVNIAHGSALELETQLRLVMELGFVVGAEIKKARGEALGVRRMLQSLHDSLRR